MKDVFPGPTGSNSSPLVVVVGALPLSPWGGTLGHSVAPDLISHLSPHVFRDVVAELKIQD